MIAVVLLVGLVAVSSIFLLLTGGVVVENSEQEAQTAKAERGMTQLDRDIDSVAYRGTDAKQTDLDLNGRGSGTVEHRDTGTISVEVEGEDDPLLNETEMGAIVYTDDEATIGYQSSAVWRGTGNGTRMVTAPGIEYKRNDLDDPSFKLLVTRVDGDLGATSSAVTIRRGPDSPRNNSVTSVDDRLVVIRITSQFYVGWADYFRSVLPSGVTVDHATNTTTVRLVPASERGGIPGGIVQTTLSEDLVLSNTIQTDSYDSRQGGYPAGKSDDGTIIAAGDVEINNNLDVDGDVVAGGNFTTNNQPTITGDIETGEDTEIEGKATVEGDSRTNATLNLTHPNSEIQGNATYGTLGEDDGTIVGTDNASYDGRDYTPDRANVGLESSDVYIDFAAETYKTDSPDSFPDCSSGCTLDEGTYHFDEIDLKNDGDVVLKPGNGTMHIFVENQVSIEGTDVVIEGDGAVFLYVNSSIPGAGTSSTNDFEFRQGDVNVQNNDSAKQFWVFVRSDGNVELDGGAGGPSHFDGVIYGASGNETADGTRIDLRNKVEVFGAIVGDVRNVEQGSAVHFDRALLDTEPAPAGSPVVEWLHILFRVAEISTEE